MIILYIIYTLATHMVNAWSCMIHYYTILLIIMNDDLIVVGLGIYLIVDQQHNLVRSLQTSPSLQFHTPQRQ